MRQKTAFPLIVSIIIIILAVPSILAIKTHWTQHNISINKPIISKIKANSKTPNLKSIIHDAEKSVLQIEGHDEFESTTGSGFLFNDKGDIITNAHVIKDATMIYVRTANAHIYPAAVIGIGEEIDIAVIRVPELSGKAHLFLDKDIPADIGDEIIALGSPHGFQNSATIGIISGVDRNFSVDGFDYKNAYQISARITHGNSGGPLINRYSGKVVGINSVGTDDGTIGFSIPITEVVDQVEEWSETTDNDKLDFTFTGTLLDNFNLNELKEDSKYIIEYFFESIQIRDYVNAYALLGSGMQTKDTYSDFREKYIRIVELDYSDISTNIVEDNQSKTQVAVTIESNLQNKDETGIKTHQYEFLIGLENDQLKILNITRE